MDCGGGLKKTRRGISNEEDEEGWTGMGVCTEEDKEGWIVMGVSRRREGVD